MTAMPQAQVSAGCQLAAVQVKLFGEAVLLVNASRGMVQMIMVHL
jgi:hypothetical protein